MSDGEWLISDSEGEGSRAPRRPKNKETADLVTSPIETPATVEKPHRVPATHSSISTFTNPPPKVTESTISSYTPIMADTSMSSSKPAPSRPRPRPAFKNKAAKASSDGTAPTSEPTSVIQTPPDPPPQPTVIVDTTSAPPTVLDDITSVPLDFSEDIAERTKRRSRTASKNTPSYFDGVIELSSDDELMIGPSVVAESSARPKPRPVKRLKLVHPEPGDVSIAESEARTIPVLSSSIPLPPSDPPAPSSFPKPPSPPTRSPSIMPPPPVTSPRPQLKRKQPPGPAPETKTSRQDGRDTVQANRDALRMPPPPAPSPVFIGSSIAGPGAGPEHSVVPSSDKSATAGRKGKSATKKEPGKSKAPAKKPRAKKETSGKGTLQVVIQSPVKKGAQTAKAAPAETALGADSTLERIHPPAGPSTSRVEDAYIPSIDDDSLSPVPGSEDEDELQLLPKRSSAISSRGAKQVKSAKGKEKAVVDDDEEEDEEIPIKRRSAKRKATLIIDEDDDAASVASSQTPSKRVRKEKAQGRGRKNEEGGNSVAIQSSANQTNSSNKSSNKQAEPGTPVRSKENVHPNLSKDNVQPADSAKEKAPAASVASAKATPPAHFARRNTVIPRRGGVSEAIRRASSHPNNPFASSPARVGYCSPLVKTSKSALNGMVHLLTIRRTPPPPPPPPPKKKKTKKEEEREAKWELELEDTVDGWWALSDEERKAWRKAKRDKEMGYLED